MMRIPGIDFLFAYFQVVLMTPKSNFILEASRDVSSVPGADRAPQECSASFGITPWPP